MKRAPNRSLSQQLPVSWLEKAILISFIVMCLISAGEAFISREFIAKTPQMQANKPAVQQEELMAQRSGGIQRR